MIMIEPKPVVIGQSVYGYDAGIPGASHVWECNDVVFLKRLAMAHCYDIWFKRFPKLRWPDHPVAYKTIMVAGLLEKKGEQAKEYARRLSSLTLTRELCWEASGLPPTV